MSVINATSKKHPIQKNSTIIASLTQSWLLWRGNLNDSCLDQVGLFPFLWGIVLIELIELPTLGGTIPYAEDPILQACMHSLSLCSWLWIWLAISSSSHFNFSVVFWTLTWNCELTWTLSLSHRLFYSRFWSKPQKIARRYHLCTYFPFLPLLFYLDPQAMNRDIYTHDESSPLGSRSMCQSLKNLLDKPGMCPKL